MQKNNHSLNISHKTMVKEEKFNSYTVNLSSYRISKLVWFQSMVDEK